MFRKPLYTPTKFAIVYLQRSLPIADAEAPRDGDYIVHSSGNAFFVTGVTRSKKLPNRFNCRCLRWTVAEIPAGARVHTTTPLKSNKKRRLRQKPPLVPFLPTRNDGYHRRDDEYPDDDQDAGV